MPRPKHVCGRLEGPCGTTCKQAVASTPEYSTFHLPVVLYQVAETRQLKEEEELLMVRAVEGMQVWCLRCNLSGL
jgi:hypothetical protein